MIEYPGTEIRASPASRPPESVPQSGTDAMISYGQNREDVLLNRLFPADYKGFYIDVGANHPTQDSVTAHFYSRGWQGINVEPSSCYDQVAQARKRDINLQVAVSNRTGDATLHEFPTAPGLSTFSAALAEDAIARFGCRCVKRQVPVLTLAEVCRRHVRGPIDFLSVDVEGHEREVLEGAAWKEYRPRVVVVEATRPKTSEPTHCEWEDLLLQGDYLFAFFDGLNRFYVRAEDRDLIPRLAVPANVHDDFLPYTEYCNSQMGPATLKIAKRLNRLEQRFPRLSETVLRWWLICRGSPHVR